MSKEATEQTIGKIGDLFGNLLASRLFVEMGIIR